MKRFFLLALSVIITITLTAQNVMTPELLWSLGRVGAVAQSPDGNKLLYRVATTDMQTEKSNSVFYILDIKNESTYQTNLFNTKHFVQWDNNGLYAQDNSGTLWLSKDEGNSWQVFAKGLAEAENIRIAPDGKIIAFSKHVSAHKVLGKEIYTNAPNTTAQIYDELNTRHWDTWYDGKVSHLFIASPNAVSAAIDIMKGEPYDCPQKPFGGTEDFIWSPDSKTLVYVCKKKLGKDYYTSTNTDIYAYDIKSAKTENWSAGMKGYDMAPAFSKDGKSIAWLSMKRDGYEADKNDIIVMDIAKKSKKNITATWDESVDGGFAWSEYDNLIYYYATVKATEQLFSVSPKDVSGKSIKQITSGVHNITGIAAQAKNNLIVSRTDMNHATELFKVDIYTGEMKAVTHVNDKIYNSIALSKIEMKMVPTTDNKEMGVWVIYPPNFDASKKYPTLLYCQGGPQSAVSQFYSLRWNFQLMAAQGYIVVAPNRRGLPGWGVSWNEEISKDWGGQPIRDYLSAIDYMAKEPFVDEKRLGAVGASYGGYSVFMLAGVHQNRFKTFISHCGLFDMKSWYGTTEEMWFANWDLGGSYWQQPQPKSYQQFDPSNYVSQWNTPILIIQGGLDFRVPTEQGLEAYKAAQLQGIKSRFLYFPNENHWVLKAHNGIVWQSEFYKWLNETL